jgi:nucleoid DNA-binding protein
VARSGKVRSRGARELSFEAEIQPIEARKLGVRLWIRWTSCGCIRGDRADFLGIQLSTEESMAAKKAEAKAKKAAGALSKSGLINALVEASGELTRKQVKAVLEALVEVGHKELKKNGLFTMPGFAKFRVVKKPATKARQGINPFTKQPITIPAKPASKSVRARAIKAVKEAVS